jgi:hypothetical protein
VGYGINSLPPGRADAARLLAYTRWHWHIETRAHWVRDVTFDEDRSQVRVDSIPQVMAALRRVQSPYGPNVNLPADLANDPTIGKIGIGRENNIDSPFPRRSDQLTDAEQFQSVWWYFEGEACRVTKAMRIPITFVRKTDGRTISANILIGFEGPGA